MRIQKSLLTGLLLSLTTIFTFPVHAGEDHAISTNRHCLWKVDGPHSVVYLLGSIHLLKRDDYPLDRPIETAFTNAQVAVFETDMDKLEQPEMQMTLMGKAQLPEGETLEQHLTPATYALFSNHVSRAGLPLAMFNRFKPFIAASAIAVIELQKLELDPAFGVDKYFSGRAAKEGKRVIPLESVDFQIDLLTGFSREEGELVMKTSLADMDKMMKEFKDIINSWRTGDAAKLETLLNEATREAPAIFKRLVADRNRNWIPQIEKLLAGDKNAIVVVGAAHLVGGEGVVELLKKQGLKVSQL